jgi:hypothetical protein
MTVMPHWSATRFMTWEQCPGEFKARYIDAQPFDMTEAVAFGQAVHLGLEAHFNGQDGIRAFRAAWKAIVLEHLLDVDPNLTRMGMDLIEQVLELDLHGIPERGFSIDTNEELGAPIVGSIDLWGSDNTIVDFKTTRGLWSQERAQKELWQPVLYAWARWNEDPDYEGAFEYIVMNRISGQVQRFCREWTADEIKEQMNEAWDRMRCIANDVRADRYVCRGKHGFCPECGERWAHDHVCDVRTTQRIRLHAQT